jgi:hypothetical protein
MKKSTRKLVVRSETLCTLRAMNDTSLSCAAASSRPSQEPTARFKPS